MTKENKEQPVRGDILRKAFDQLDILGRTVKEILIEDIQRRGIILDSNNSYELKDIEKKLLELLGEDATSLLVERLRRSIEALKSIMIAAAPVAGLFLLSCTVHA